MFVVNPRIICTELQNIWHSGRIWNVADCSHSLHRMGAEKVPFYASLRSRLYHLDIKVYSDTTWRNWIASSQAFFKLHWKGSIIVTESNDTRKAASEPFSIHGIFPPTTAESCSLFSYSSEGNVDEDMRDRTAIWFSFFTFIWHKRAYRRPNNHH